VPVNYLVVHLGLPDALKAPEGDNCREAARRSIEEIAALADPLGVQLALEVIPNRLATPRLAGVDAGGRVGGRRRPVPAWTSAMRG